MTLKLYGLKEIPLVKKGDNIAKIIEEDLEKENIALEDGDILLIAETLISKAEGNKRRNNKNCKRMQKRSKTC